MLSFNDVFRFSTNRNISNLGIKEYTNLSSDAMELLRCEYWLQLNNPYTKSEANMINDKYNDKSKVKSLGKRK